MTTIPQNEVTQADLIEWENLSKELSRIKAAEMLLRTKIYKGLFAEPKEGVNSVPLANNYELKADRKISRSIDEAAMNANIEQLSAVGVILRDIVKFEPQLILSNYRKLTAEQLQVVDQFVESKDGAPSLKIVLPAKAKKGE